MLKIVSACNKTTIFRSGFNCITDTGNVSSTYSLMIIMIHYIHSCINCMTMCPLLYALILEREENRSTRRKTLGAQVR